MNDSLLTQEAQEGHLHLESVEHMENMNKDLTSLPLFQLQDPRQFYERKKVVVRVSNHIGVHIFKP